MTLYFRLVALVLAAFLTARTRLSEPSQLHGRVWPLDLDINLHMTNSRYFALADLGRVNLILRTGAWRAMRRGKLGMVMAGCAIRFRRSLRPFERYTLTTSLLGWDARWVYLKQEFTGREGVACIAMMRTAFTRHGRVVPPQEFIDLSATPGWNLHPPDWVKTWNDLETEFVAEPPAAP